MRRMLSIRFIFLLGLFPVVLYSQDSIGTFNNLFNSGYSLTAKGTLTRENIIVSSLLSRGWVWGGDWSSPKDYQHLEKE